MPLDVPLHLVTTDEVNLMRRHSRPSRIRNTQRWVLLTVIGVFLRNEDRMSASAFAPRNSVLSQRVLRTTSRKFALPPDLLHNFIQSSSHLVSEKINLVQLPFEEVGRELAQALDIGSGLNRAKIPEGETSVVLESIGYDLLIFLAASVVVTPLSKALQITPILGYLMAGALLGPFGMDIFANSKADLELGDFGILFLLFSEGLDVSRERLGKLSNYLPLAFAQISLTTLAITALLTSGVPALISQIIPLSPAVMQLQTPVQSVVLGLTGALSTSAFIFPVLKERGWEEEPTGHASTSILLLQDLMVAPLLVILPFLAGSGNTDWGAVGFLTAKATLGFGSVLYIGSFILSKLFSLVAQAKSSETFVALCLLVSVGMGVIAKMLGLTDTAGAFAAGVLLANTNYRAQIQADILPFKGILLGIFFMDAGSTFDINLVLSNWVSVLTGSAVLLMTKAAVLKVATRVPEQFEPNRLSKSDAIRTSLLLAGGGEFAFVVLALAEKLQIVPLDLGAILNAIVLITMGVTPLLGDLAVNISRESGDDDTQRAPQEATLPPVAKNAIVVCGYGEVGRSLLHILGQTRGLLFEEDFEHPNVPHIVAFDTDPALLNSAERPGEDTIVLYGNGASGEVVSKSGVSQPTAIFVAYEHFNTILSATARLRTAFPDTPIYTRATTRCEAQSLRAVGATDVIVEAEELPKSATALLRGNFCSEANLALQTEEQVRLAAAKAAGITSSEVMKLMEIYKSMDQNGSGRISAKEMANILERSTNWIATDDDIKELDTYIESTLHRMKDVDFIDFCRLYGAAPVSVQQSFGVKKLGSAAQQLSSS